MTMFYKQLIYACRSINRTRHGNTAERRTCVNLAPDLNKSDFFFFNLKILICSCL